MHGSKTEQDLARMNRLLEAREAGMSLRDATRFSKSDVDVGRLRKLVRDGCPAKLLAKILL